MSKQLNITDFRYGLDSRRSELTSRNGVLLRLNNGYVTEGAEIFKRKAWVKNALKAGCFGALALPNGNIMVFGSIATPSGLPANVTYQRLTSPLGSAMTVFVGAQLFNGQAFVVTTFGADGTFCFYNGTLVSDFTSGLVLTGLTSDPQQANNLVALANATSNYTAAIGSTSSTVVITGKNGASYTAAETLTSAAGVISESQLTTSQAGTSGVQAIGSFTIQAGALGGGGTKAGITTVQVYTNNGVPFSAVLNSSTILFNTDVSTTAGAVAANINSNAGANGGYSATSNGGVVSIYAPIGSQYNGLLVNAITQCSSDGTGAIILENCQFNFFLPTGSPTLTVSSVVESNSAITLTTTSHALSTTLNALLVAIATDINTNIANGGYFALAIGNTLYVSYETDTGGLLAPDTITVNYTASAGVTIGGSAALQGTPSVNAVSGSGVNGVTSSQVTIVAAGGTGPYKYHWSITNVNRSGAPVPGGIIINNPSSNSTTFSIAPITSGPTNPLLPFVKAVITATAICTITDANGNTVNVSIGLTMTVTYQS